MLALPLAGCTEARQRPGNSEARADADFTRCIQAARLDIPPRIARRQAAPERVVTRQVCTDQGGRRVCRDEFVRRESARDETVDLNLTPRMELARACLRAQGYERDGMRFRAPAEGAVR
jgi:hypothetical protein